MEAIWLIEEAKQFDQITKGITYFDGLISGSRMTNVTVSDEAISTVKSLYNQICAGAGTKTKEHKYIISSFKTFIQSKSEICLHLGFLQQCVEELVLLIMHSLDKMDRRDNSHKRIIKKRQETDFSNLCRSELFEVFTNAKRLVIRTGLRNQYTFSFLALLSLIKFGDLDKVIVIGGNWLDWNSQRHWKQETKYVIQQRYIEAKYNITVELSHEEQQNKYAEYECIIEKL